MTIKISQLGNLTAVLGNVSIPMVSNVAGTLTTVKGNVTQLAQFINTDSTLYGNLIPGVNDVMSLGNVTHRWKDLWVSGTTIYVGNTTISSTSTGEISVAPAPTTIFNGLINANNLVPANIWVTGAYANGSGTLSATLYYNDGGGNLNTLAMTYGTDYQIVATTGGNANIRVLLETSYMYGTLGWAGFGNLVITETPTEVSSISSSGMDIAGVSRVRTLELREPDYDGFTANGTVALYVSSAGGAWGDEGALIVEGNNSDGNGIVPSNPSQYTLGTVDFPWLNVYADEITSPTINTINATLAALDANAATQADSLTLLLSNAAVQAGAIATLTSNAAVQAGLISDLTANAGAQAGLITTINSNIATITANLGNVSGDIATLTANAATQSDAIAQVTSDLDITANAVSNYSPNVQVAAFLPIYSGNISGSGNTIVVGGNLVVTSGYVPSANNSAGSAGQIAWDSNYIYICTAASTWRRANISTW
jgi:hypothetical protein